MEIGRNVALAEIDKAVDDNGKTVFFSLSFYTSAGEYRHIKKCSKNWKKPTEKSSQPNFSKVKNLFNIKEKGLLLIYDHEQERHISIHVQLITNYNGYSIRH
jgi:hypothetical protein